MALALDLLAWLTTVEFNALGTAHRLLGLSDQGTSIVSLLFGLWLLGFLVMLTFVLVSAQSGPVRPPASQPNPELAL